MLQRRRQRVWNKQQGQQALPAAPGAAQPHPSGSPGFRFSPVSPEQLSSSASTAPSQSSSPALSLTSVASGPTLASPSSQSPSQGP